MIDPKTYAVNPKDWRLFKVWITITPMTDQIDGQVPKITKYREMGRLAIRAYDQLGSNAKIKLPHGQSSANDVSGVMSSLRNSMGYTPQIGNNSPYLYVSGHFYSNRDIKDPYSSVPVYSSGVLYNIPSGNPKLVAPHTNVLEDIKELKGIIDEEMATVLPAGVGYKVDKIDYLGLRFGSGGYHFPR